MIMRYNIHDDFPDKYKETHFTSKAIDCYKGLEAGCQVKCCSFRFGLTPQDVEEGIVQWDPFLRFMNKVGEDGYCVHLDRKEWKCGIYYARLLHVGNILAKMIQGY